MGNSFEISSNHPLGENFSNLPQLNQFEQTGEPKGNIWKGENVNLPFYSMNINELSNRWQKIRFSLNTLTKNLDKCESDDISQKVMEAIVKYCPEYERDPAYNFTNLLYLFGSYSGPENFDMNSEDLKQLLKKNDRLGGESRKAYHQTNSVASSRHDHVFVVQHRAMRVTASELFFLHVPKRSLE